MERANQPIVLVILISDNIDFDLNSIRRDEEGHYIVIQGFIQEEEIMLINVYRSNARGKVNVNEFKERNSSIVEEYLNTHKTQWVTFTPHKPFDTSNKANESLS